MKILLKILKYLGLSLLVIVLLAMVFILICNILVVLPTQAKILHSPQELNEKASADNKDYEAILVFGAGIYGDKPSPILRARLDTAIKLYKDKLASKIIMSGDHSPYHNEPEVMKNYALKQGVNKDDIILDHYGYSSYESVARLKAISDFHKVILVSQDFHLNRCLYIADRLKLDALAVASVKSEFASEAEAETREFFVRVKDYFYSNLESDKFSKQPYDYYEAT